MKCAHKNCEAEASTGFTLNIPPTQADHRMPIRLTPNLPLCAEHFASLEPADVITPDLKRMVRTLSYGRPAPDFDRAFFTPLPLDSAEFQRVINRQPPPE